jgi:predicted CoA-binding protein
MTTMAAVQDFLAQRTLALVGVSRDEKAFSNVVYRELRQRGHEMVPVNPHADELEGDRCVHSVDELPDDVDGVLVMVPPEQVDEVVDACVARGVPRVWLFKGAGGKGSVTEHAVALCREHGIEVVDGQCPMMFAEPVAWFHRVHGAGKKLAHTYPA